MSLGEIQHVSEGIYAYLQPDGSWWLNNTGFLVSAAGVISVDTASTERRTRAYLDAIGTVTSLPVRTLVNTHTTATTRTATTWPPEPPLSGTTSAARRYSPRRYLRRPGSGQT